MVLSKKQELQLEYVSLGSAIMLGCEVHLYLQFLLQLVHLYSMNHILQDGMLLFWQKIFILRVSHVRYMVLLYDQQF